MFYCSLFSFPEKHGILSMVIDMDVDKKLIGKRIRHRREVAGLSQEQLAEKLALSTNHIPVWSVGRVCSQQNDCWIYAIYLAAHQTTTCWAKLGQRRTG